MSMVAIKTGKGGGKYKNVKLEICDGGGTCCSTDVNKHANRRVDSTDTYMKLGDCVFVSIFAINLQRFSQKLVLLPSWSFIYLSLLQC